jgi:dynein heavy chain 1
VENQPDEMRKRHWIVFVFDGDVDPGWVENLNSVLDENKSLTLPNGEPINLPQNVRVVFEVENLNFATPVGVSRCGIVFFSQNKLSSSEILKFYKHQLSTEAIITANYILLNEFIDLAMNEMIGLQSALGHRLSSD